MAYTTIHAIKTTIDKSIAYICNSEKTDDSTLISSFGCSPKTAHYDFKFALSSTNASDTNKAFHLVQAFAEGEVTPDLAHQIGIELADRLLKGHFSYVVATHTNTKHIHNHIIFCAADNFTHQKYHDCKKTYYHIRSLNDKLCNEHQLSVIVPGKKRGKKYNEWLAKKNGTSAKQQLLKDIDFCITLSHSYGHFIELMRAKGYEIKGTGIDNDTLKYISFKPLGMQRFVRGSEKSLGSEYTRECIKERIESTNFEKRHKQYIPPKRDLDSNLYERPVYQAKKELNTDYSSKELINLNDEKIQNNFALMQWAKRENLKITASTYSTAPDKTSLAQDLAIKQDLAKTMRETLRELEQEMKATAEILKYAEQYNDTKIYHFRYKKSKDPDRYFRDHEAEIILFNGAQNMLKRAGIDLKNLNVQKIQDRYDEMEAKATELEMNYEALYKNIEIFSKNVKKLEKIETNNKSHPHKQFEKI